MRCHNKIQLLSVLNTHLVAYPTPMNLNYSWNGGSLAGIMLASQMLTGILLAMHYVGHVDYAFASVQHLMTDVPSGMILRYAHANGASLFFIVVYLHILRGMYYGSGAQPREMVWITGVVILLLMIITAFIGYVLPWGQMSFWGATVITSLATAIPVVGKHIMYWLWGGFSVDNPTLNRFYSFHYTLPFVLAGLSVFHIAALHQYGSTNPLGVNSQSSLISFGTYFGAKDLLGALYLALVFAMLVFFYPDLLGHPDNLIPANPYSTPQHIVPEWYFLWVYAILRSIPNKAMGVLAIGLVFASLILMPFIGLGGGKFRIITEWLYWTFLADVLLLTWLGGNEITPITSFVGQMCTGYLFLYLLVFQPFIGYLETQFSQGTVKSIQSFSLGFSGHRHFASFNPNGSNRIRALFDYIISLVTSHKWFVTLQSYNWVVWFAGLLKEAEAVRYWVQYKISTSKVLRYMLISGFVMAKLTASSLLGLICLILLGALLVQVCLLLALVQYGPTEYSNFIVESIGEPDKLMVVSTLTKSRHAIAVALSVGAGAIVVNDQLTIYNEGNQLCKTMVTAVKCLGDDATAEQRQQIISDTLQTHVTAQAIKAQTSFSPINEGKAIVEYYVNKLKDNKDN